MQQPTLPWSTLYFSQVRHTMYACRIQLVPVARKVQMPCYVHACSFCCAYATRGVVESVLRGPSTRARKAPPGPMHGVSFAVGEEARGEPSSPCLACRGE